MKFENKLEIRVGGLAVYNCWFLEESSNSMFADGLYDVLWVTQPFAAEEDTQE